MMLIPTFTVKLGQPIFPQRVVIGKFDGKSPSLACVTTGGKVLIHSPHEANRSNDTQSPQFRYLNFNRKITSLACVASEQYDHDIIFVGSESNLTAYDVERNSEIFFREVSDGVNALAIGSMAPKSKPIVVAGGNCSILGFDNEGNESFWTVTGDNIASLAFCDIDLDGQLELLVGSDDFEIRVFKNVEMIHEITESDKVILLCAIKYDKFAYGLANGTVGVYKGYKGEKSRLWRVKTKTIPTSIIACDLNNDGTMQLISGWMNGSFNIRNSENGELLYRGTADSSIASILRYDYKMNGKSQLIICSTLGEIIGYEPADIDTIAISNTVKGVVTEVNSTQSKDANEQLKSEDQKALMELQSKKLEYLNQLKIIEKESMLAKSISNTTSSTTANMILSQYGSLPTNTNIKYELIPDAINGCLNVIASVTTDVLIVSLILIDLDGSLLEGCEIATLSPITPSRTVTMPIRLNKYQGATVKLQAHLAVRSTLDQLHVLEATMSIPKFAGFRLVDEVEANQTIHNFPESRTRGQVMIVINESLTSLAKYISTSFIFAVTFQLSLEKLKIHFLSVCGPASPSAIAAAAAAATDGLGGINGSTGNQLHNSNGNEFLHSNMNGSSNTKHTLLQGRNRPLQIIAQEIDGNTASSSSSSAYNRTSQSSNKGYLKIKIRTDCMDLAAELVQDLARHFKVSELEAEADFPEEFDEFEEILRTVSEHNESRLRLSADMADDSQRIKALVVRAEDSRILCDMETMRRSYTGLQALNIQLLNQHTFRAQNQERLLAALRSVNLMIQRAAGLRVGNAKQEIIAECRKAIKNNNMSALQRIIKYGNDKGSSSSSSVNGVSPRNDSS